MTQRDHLAQSCAPLTVIEVGADPEYRQLVMPELLDAIRLTASQNVDEMGSAEALAGSIDSRTKAFAR